MSPRLIAFVVAVTGVAFIAVSVVLLSVVLP